MWNDEQESVTDEEREAVLRELFNELMNDAHQELVYCEAVAREAEPIPSDDEIPW
jgi:hypothetical protein